MTRDKLKLLNSLLREQFNAITEDDIMMYRGNKFYIAGNEMPKKDVMSLQSGAVTIKTMYVWELLVKEMKYMANKRIYESSQSIDDVVFGKAMLYAIDVIEKKLDNLSKLK